MFVHLSGACLGFVADTCTANRLGRVPAHRTALPPETAADPLAGLLTPSHLCGRCLPPPRPLPTPQPPPHSLPPRHPPNPLYVPFPAACASRLGTATGLHTLSHPAAAAARPRSHLCSACRPHAPFPPRPLPSLLSLPPPADPMDTGTTAVLAATAAAVTVAAVATSRSASRTVSAGVRAAPALQRRRPRGRPSRVSPPSPPALTAAPPPTGRPPSGGRHRPTGAPRLLPPRQPPPNQPPAARRLPARRPPARPPARASTAHRGAQTWSRRRRRRVMGAGAGRPPCPPRLPPPPQRGAPTGAGRVGCPSKKHTPKKAVSGRADAPKGGASDTPARRKHPSRPPVAPPAARLRVGRASAAGVPRTPLRAAPRHLPVWNSGCRKRREDGRGTCGGEGRGGGRER
ncbi:hypothetical protein BU14_0159s0033 [Porphyra umbilicalis]|uniref:Uncharacterized protein n=1 Tax=Porphyra umbilicalis TaxID=2786 RepID=A0A1X6P8K0_PORUM|nr:hypothetical protein BU14_0159s0033 [Porphyra umbilicalis]|eukprot:OSX77178.1 hypothetical protein BU14_0159s0033 [Porphyra umbilicalis]